MANTLSLHDARPIFQPTSGSAAASFFPFSTTAFVMAFRRRPGKASSGGELTLRLKPTRKLIREARERFRRLMIMAFKIAEDKRVLLPALVGLDAFVLTHTMEVVDSPTQEEVDKFLPPYKPDHVYLDPKRPITIGSFGTPEFYTEFRYAQELAMSKEAPKVIDEVFKEWERTFGRKYQKVTAFECKDADIIFVSMGSMTGTARETVKKLRAAGKKVGLCKITVLRPFPEKEL
jgi:pyruvate ferredoxin oxidoreductase alpha subunit